MCLNNVTYVFEQHRFMQWMIATELRAKDGVIKNINWDFYCRFPH